jgi:hypothetical protein
MCKSSCSSSQHEMMADLPSAIMKSKSPLRKRLESLSRVSLSEMEEVASLSSSSFALKNNAEGFESGFENFQDFLEYSSERLSCASSSKTKSKTTTASSEKQTHRLTKRIKKSLLKHKSRFRTINNHCLVQRIMNGFALLFRGALAGTINFLIVLVVIIALTV